MRILFVITARGGSKGVPGKNIKMVGKLPLIAYKIISAKKCKYESRTIVSTEDAEIARTSKEYGAEVPFMRPEELATDSANSTDVILHAMHWIIENDSAHYDYICALEPSSPFASYVDLNHALDLIVEKDADTLLGMKEAEVSTRFIHPLDLNGGLSEFYHVIKKLPSVRRQDQKREYTMNGCMYIAKWDYFMKNKLFHSEKSVPYIMSAENSVEIDTMLDYNIACHIIEKGIIDFNLWL